MPSQLTIDDDGMLEVTVATGSGEQRSERTTVIDVMVVGFELSAAAVKQQNKEITNAEWIKEIIAILGQHGLPNLSGKAALGVHEYIISHFDEGIKKNVATPLPEAAPASPSPTTSTPLTSPPAN